MGIQLSPRGSLSSRAMDPLGEYVAVEHEVQGDWVAAGSVSVDEPAGSVTSEPPDGERQVYLFGWLGDRGPAVWRSRGGFDRASAAVREISSLGLDLLADLTAGPYVLDRWVPISQLPGRLRFTHCRE